MFSRFCKLCHRRADISVVNLRRYGISSKLLQEHENGDDKLPEKDNRILIIKSKRPKFNFYNGTTYGKFEKIPLVSEGWHNSKSTGDYFLINPVHDEENTEFPDELNTFEAFHLHPKLIENLRDNNIREPTEIQKLGIPTILAGRHTTLSAETGCGKTLAFLLPTLNNIMRWKALKMNEERQWNSPFGLIITPSRELADQIGTEAKKLTKGLNIDVKVVTGGRTKRLMATTMLRNVDLLVGSFGAISKLTTTRIYSLNYVKHLVLDEAHALFHETFEEKLEVFLRRIQFHNGNFYEGSDFPVGCQLTLVSATKPSEMPEYLSKVLDINSLTDVATENVHRVMVPQKFIRLSALDKSMTLLKLVKPKAMKKSPVIIFANDSATSDWISLFLNEFDVRTINVNGEMPMAIRKGKFAAFQRGDFSVLSTTNAGARGLDTVDVNTIINYDFPLETADYIHRCGRTGRIGTKGECRVTNFICRPLEIEVAQKIERATRRMRALPILNMPEELAKGNTKTIKAKVRKESAKRRQRTARNKRKKRARKPLNI